MISELDPESARGIQQCLSTAQGQNIIRHFKARAERAWDDAFEEFRIGAATRAEDWVEDVNKKIDFAFGMDQFVDELESLHTGGTPENPTEYLQYE